MQTPEHEASGPKDSRARSSVTRALRQGREVQEQAPEVQLAQILAARQACEARNPAALAQIQRLQPLAGHQRGELRDPGGETYFE